jgi:hypothetical protein
MARRILCFVVLCAVVGCVDNKPTTATTLPSANESKEAGPSDDRKMADRQVDLIDLWKLNEAVFGTTGKAAKSAEEMEPYVKILHPTDNGFRRIKSGKIVFVWDDEFFTKLSLDERGKLAVAWDKFPDRDGNVAVLFGDGMRKTVSVKDLETLNKYRATKR